MAISHSAHLLAIMTESGIALVDGRTGKRRQMLDRTAECHVAAFSPDGRVLAIGSAEDGSVQLWETVSGRKRRTFTGHGQPIRSMAFSADGRRLATGSDDTTVLIWDMR
jgi:WD40 repeat protein